MSASTQLQEGLEAQVAETKAELKEALVETFTTMREALGYKDVDREAIKNRSEDSIKDSLTDLRVDFKESLTKKERDFMKFKDSLEDPSFKEKRDSSHKKDEEPGIDLREQLHGIFNDILNTHK